MAAFASVEEQAPANDVRVVFGGSLLLVRTCYDWLCQSGPLNDDALVSSPMYQLSVLLKSLYFVLAQTVLRQALHSVVFVASAQIGGYLALSEWKKANPRLIVPGKRLDVDEAGKAGRALAQEALVSTALPPESTELRMTVRT